MAPVASSLRGASSWLLEASAKMLYLVHPKEVALNQSDDSPQYLLKFGIPMFFVLMVLEQSGIALANWYRERDSAEKKQIRYQNYRLNDSISGILLGSFQQISVLLLDMVGLELASSVYKKVWDFRLIDFDIKQYPYISFVILLLGVDCGYYWAHRFMHEFHAGWIPHSVHHSGEQYNLATALRQGALQPLFSWVFYTPLALLGFPPNAWSAHSQLSTLYMYWIHTELVNRLPLGLEYIFNSPMAHRMHHRPPGNCNYAGMLIWWDRIFGTYEAELERKEYYGLVRQPKTFAADQMNVSHIKSMANIRGKSWFSRFLSRRVPARWSCKPMAIFDPIPPLQADLRGEGPVRKQWDGHPGKPLGVTTQGYVLFATATSLGAVVKLLLASSTLPKHVAVSAALVTAAQISCIGKICDHHPRDSPRAMVASGALLPAMYLLLA